MGTRLYALLYWVFLSISLLSAQPRSYPIREIPIEQVSFLDTFWQPRLHRHQQATLPHAFQQYKKAGHLRNFELAAGRKTGKQAGVYPFEDSDLYKMMEGAARLLRLQTDSTWANKLDTLSILLGAAQRKDGYLQTWVQNKANPQDTTRWARLQFSHELYNMGHLFEAAAAHFQATGRRNLLDLAEKNAELLLQTFGEKGLQRPPGHQEVELGLVKLYQVTGKQAYLDLATFFIDQRGRYADGRGSWGEYAQDHTTAAQQIEAVGHAVRAGYYYAAMTDLAALNGRSDYLPTLQTLWENVVGKKMFVTGGIGASGFGERFGENYELPNISAYSESCSSISMVFWNHRMFRLFGEAKYIDVLERTLYNAVLSGISLTGDTFFYPNPLATRGFCERSGWMVCNCCISSFSRFMPSIGQYVYAQTDQDLYVNLYAASRLKTRLADGDLVLSQQTAYPWQGKIKLVFEKAPRKPFALRLRIPGWAQNTAIPSDLYRFQHGQRQPIRLNVNGKPIQVVLKQGFVVLERRWKAGDVVHLDLPMQVQETIAHPLVESTQSRIAWQRGPLVYALEGVDQIGQKALHLYLPPKTKLRPEYQPKLLGGLTLLKGQGYAVSEQRGRLDSQPQPLTLIPYYAWAHRGLSEMTVWIPQNAEATEPMGSQTFAQKAKITTSSGENSLQAITLNPNETMVWVQYDFDRPQELASATVTWRDNEQEIRTPTSWRLLAWVEGKWQAMFNPSGQFGTQAHVPQTAHFEAARATSFRLEIKPQAGKAVSLSQWDVR